MIVHKVVRDHELERHTLDGWKLEQLLVATYADKVECMTPVPCSTQHNYTGFTTLSRQEIVQASEPRFLLSKDSEKLTLEDQLRVESREKSEKIAALEMKSKNDDRDLADLRGSVETCGKLAESHRQDANALRAKLANMESDLANRNHIVTTVRAAIGSAWFDSLAKGEDTHCSCECGDGVQEPMTHDHNCRYRKARLGK